MNDNSTRKEEIKEDFLKKITSMSINDINQYIKEKGKPIKLIKPILIEKVSYRA